MPNLLNFNPAKHWNFEKFLECERTLFNKMEIWCVGLTFTATVFSQVAKLNFANFFLLGTIQRSSFNVQFLKNFSK